MTVISAKTKGLILDRVTMSDEFTVGNASWIVLRGKNEGMWLLQSAIDGAVAGDEGWEQEKTYSPHDRRVKIEGANGIRWRIQMEKGDGCRVYLFPVKSK